MATAIAIAPPLTQSLYEVNACPTSYAFQIIEGHKGGNSAQSNRGTEVHHVMSSYINHCVLNHVPANWKLFDELSGSVVNEAGKILDGLRDNYVVDFDNVVDTEITYYLDRHYNPATPYDNPAFKGTLDVVLRYNAKKMKIEDFKSHPQPFDADTFQSMLYPFLLFMHYPEVEEITFELIFVRYANARRSVTWTRKDVPDMMVQIERGRNRQLKTHADYEDEQPIHDLPVLPGNHCFYCPLQANGGCPQKEFNPYTANDMRDLVLDLKFCEDRAKYVRNILKEAVQASGRPIVASDNNGESLTFETRGSESQVYPALDTITALADWEDATGEDLRNKVTISSSKLKPLLKAKKRTQLKEIIDRHIAQKVTKTSTKLYARDSGEDDRQDEDFFA